MNRIRKKDKGLKKYLNMEIVVDWTDSYGVTTGWQDVSEYSAGKLIIRSYGRVIFENEEIISLAHNFAEETKYTPKQANGIMVIPKACIISVASFSSCRRLASKRLQRQI